MDQAQKALDQQRNRQINEMAASRRQQEITKDLNAKLANRNNPSLIQNEANPDAKSSTAGAKVQNEAHPDAKSSAAGTKVATPAHGSKPDPISFLDGLLGKA